MSDEAMDAEEKEFDLYMEIIEPPIARPQKIPREKGTMLKCVHDLYISGDHFIKKLGHP